MIPVDQRKADMSDPQQFAAWALSSFPVRDDGTPLILPVVSLPLVSEHLYRCGFRHHPELQEIRQEVDERAGMLQAGITWVPCSGDEEESVPQIDLSNLTDAEADAVADALRRRSNNG